jgi:hypothetical protein
VVYVCLGGQSFANLCVVDVLLVCGACEDVWLEYFELLWSVCCRCVVYVWVGGLNFAMVCVVGVLLVCGACMVGGLHFAIFSVVGLLLMCGACVGGWPAVRLRLFV